MSGCARRPCGCNLLIGSGREPSLVKMQRSPNAQRENCKYDYRKQERYQWRTAVTAIIIRVDHRAVWPGCSIVSRLALFAQRAAVLLHCFHFIISDELGIRANKAPIEN